MTKSMTGFGRCELVKGQQKITVELKAVNHRYFDLSVKMPRKLNCFEQKLRNLLKEYIGRGKVDFYVSYENYEEKSAGLHYNEALAGEYLSYLHQMAAAFSIKDDISAAQLSRYPEVFTMEELGIDESTLWELLEEATRTACEYFVASRIAEGENLTRDLLEKLRGMEAAVAQIEERSPQILAEYQAKLSAKVEELLGDTKIEESRLATEVAIMADRLCTDEEIVRLKSHIKATRAALIDGENVGRKLDFLAQEMNREANTILSKANDLTVSNLAIGLKTEIEKIREQIQNIE